MFKRIEEEEIFIALLLFIAFLSYMFGFTSYSNVHLFIICVIGFVSTLFGLFKANIKCKYKNKLLFRTLMKNSKEV